MSPRAAVAMGTGSMRAVWMALALPLLAGCSAMGDLGHAVSGHLDLLRRARPIQDWLDDPATPPALAARLQQARRMRAFAVERLALPDGASYRRYADLGREAAVWNVVAAPALSLQPKAWCWPVVGCVSYHGHFDRSRAQAEGDALRVAGWDVMVYGVTAYSTLGRTDWLGGDPLLNTFIRGDDEALAALMFHEMTHQKVYIADDTMFNESYATAVERLGLAAWRKAQGGGPPASGASAGGAEEAARLRWRTLTRTTREALAALYAGPRSDSDKAAGKAAILKALRDQAQAEADAAPGQEGPRRRLAWAQSANNATFALAATYDRWVPAFELLFAREGQDFERLHRAVAQLAALPASQRHEALAILDAAAVAPSPDGPQPQPP